MPKVPDLPPNVAARFLQDMRAFFAAGATGIKADEIAARQIHALRQYQGRRERPIKLHEVKELFHLMRDEIG